MVGSAADEQLGLGREEVEQPPAMLSMALPTLCVI